MWWHPHCRAEDEVWGARSGVFTDVEEAVGYTPVAAEGKGNAVADWGELGLSNWEKVRRGKKEYF